MPFAVEQSLPVIFAWLAASLTVLSAIAVAVSCHFYRTDPENGPLLPMTVIRPLRGAEKGLEENLRSVIESDREGVVQVLFAVESEEDPAYTVATKVARDYPDRDVRVIVTGPSGPRMGKIHNMIEAVKAASHPVIAFSDSDMLPDRNVLIATSNAFAQGADAASALPDATGSLAPTDALVGVCFNHYFLMYGALLYKLGIMTPMAGGWMACRKEFLDRIGGLESLEDHIADDLALSMEANRLGARAALLPRFAKIRERGGSVTDVTRHLMKWTKIMRFCVPLPYLALPLLTPNFLATVALLLAWINGKPVLPYILILAALFTTRGLLAWIQDKHTASSFFPFWIYVILPLADLASIGFWFCALFSNIVAWRGKRYRLRYGGRVEVLPS